MLLLASASIVYSAQAQESRALLTGEVFSRKAQDILVPLTNTWKAGIGDMVDEGDQVRPGDIVIQFDGSEAYQQLEQQRETTRAEAAVIQRDLARLEKEVLQADYGVKQAVKTLELASMKAEVPKGLIGAIEYAENQLAKEKAIKGVEDAKSLQAHKHKGLSERQRRASLDERKGELIEAWWAEMLESLSVRAIQSGFVIHSKHPWTGAKYQEGDTVRTSFKVAQVADTTDLAIRVWVHSVDRPRIESGQNVRIVLDALPRLTITGRLESLSDSGSKRPEWGEAVYYDGIVSFDTDAVDGLLPGMSALVEIL
jgi:multidrug efflux pump subunit AcrA (membrane-fusion protein)